MFNKKYNYLREEYNSLFEKCKNLATELKQVKERLALKNAEIEELKKIRDSLSSEKTDLLNSIREQNEADLVFNSLKIISEIVIHKQDKNSKRLAEYLTAQEQEAIRRRELQATFSAVGAYNPLNSLANQLFYR